MGERATVGPALVHIDVVFLHQVANQPKMVAVDCCSKRGGLRGSESGRSGIAGG